MTDETTIHYGASCNGAEPLGAWTDRGDVERFIAGRQRDCKRLQSKDEEGNSTCPFGHPPLAEQSWEIVEVKLKVDPIPETAESSDDAPPAAETSQELGDEDDDALEPVEEPLEPLDESPPSPPPTEPEPT